ncbi:MAG: MgtC/SapB family protein [Flavobacteriales bacterium]|nr:MgtC/SapB family protein [Flavobacteriales bacterium]MBK6945415.1 MgtC/SapB family protein [Flavobacteriales bacterium]MBK7241531.1 MgtC/SapB family protein [Flavobacteriales bacterium]MBK7298360.1 MgtC/SapB family protein [Flavobacteriales bacterium]MBK9535027.1 MgtC/SapB family protein [Flavobacteriales bacterium]
MDYAYERELWILLDVGIAALLAGAVGLERELDKKPAGLRTNMVIGAVAALFILLGKIVITIYDTSLSENVEITTDPVRVFEAIVVGVSFIGAGTIMRSSNGNGVQNLTTAASLLLSAGIGISVALHLYVLAVGVALLAWVINHFMGIFERRMIHDEIDK